MREVVTPAPHKMHTPAIAAPRQKGSDAPHTRAQNMDAIDEHVEGIVVQKGGRQGRLRCAAREGITRSAAKRHTHSHQSSQAGNSMSSVLFVVMHRKLIVADGRCRAQPRVVGGIQTA